MTRFHVNGKVVNTVDLLRKRHWRFRFKSLPVAIIYATWMIFIAPSLDFLESFIVLGGLLALLILVYLFTVCSVDFKCFVQYSKVNDIHYANACKITPTKFCGSKQIVPLRKVTRSLADEIYFNFRNQCFIYSIEKNTFCKLPYPSKETFGYYLKSTGYTTKATIREAADKYGDNVFEYPEPTFPKLVKEHTMDPLFVFQVFCVGLWCVDGYCYISMFTLFWLFIAEPMMAKIWWKTLSGLKCVRLDSHMLMVYRRRKWRKVQGRDLLPGDIVSIGCVDSQHEGEEIPVPADMLILAGTATVNEAILTGESIPQRKVSILDRGPNENFYFKRDKKHVLFGGTKMLQHSPDMTFHMKTPDCGCLAIVLRTGFRTTQGKLMLTVLSITERVTGNGWENGIFFLFIFLIAVMAAVYVFKKGLEDPNMIRHKLLLSCFKIVNSAIPPELPTLLLMAVTASLAGLRWRDIFCTEPLRIPFAGKVDICFFDKTGTLTSDDMEFSGVGGLIDDINFETDINNKVPKRTLEILAYCHALVFVDNKLVGDPLEKAAINWIDWSYKSEGKKTGGVQIVQRHNFASHLKRMAVVVRTEDQFYAFVKGAPETIQERLNDIPEFYVSAYKRFTRQGSHVLALAYKGLPDMTVSEAGNLDREVVESGLMFAGFAVFDCPIRGDSATVLSELKKSSLDLVMMTGDHALTACHVAREVNIISQPVLILVTSKNKQQYQWVSPDETETVSYSEEMVEGLAEGHDLCIGGDCFDMLLQTYAFVKVIPYVKVFARVAPEQKELIIATFKSFGRITLMCGDGTNDIRALKQAHVGVALLNERPPPDASNCHLTPADSQSQELFEGVNSRLAPIVKPGDTSMASPFTAVYASVSPTIDIIRQGRSTLVITLQIFKILGLSCLSTLYVLSVMYLNGVRLGEGEASISGIFTTAFFISILDARPLPTLSTKRPHPNVFCFYVFVSILGQFGLHIIFLNLSVKEAEKHMGDVGVKRNPEFESNLVNTVSYMASMMIQIATFAVNYIGHPFNQSISENKSFKFVFLGAVVYITLITSDMFRGLNDLLMLVPLPRGLREKLLIWAAFMFFGCYTWERFLRCAFPSKSFDAHKNGSMRKSHF